MDQTILQRITMGAMSAMTEKEFLEKEIEAWETSQERLLQIQADRYYEGYHDIKDVKRMVIGENGSLVEVDNLPNNKIVDNQYANAVDMKTNYLFSKPFTVETKNDDYAGLLAKVFDNRFRRKFKKIGRGAINQGISWLHPYYGDDGKLKYKVFDAWEVLPFWKDSEHTELDAAVRVYTVEGYEGTKPVTITKVEYYTTKGVERYTMESHVLTPDVENPSSSHFTYDGRDFNWERVPLIPFKFDDKESPLLKRVKSLQDAINKLDSDFMNNMEETPRTSIIVLENYDGTNLGEFRRNLATYGAVKVFSQDGSRGDVRTLKVEVNAENYKTVRTMLKEALISNARSVDAKDDRMGSGTNEKNLQSMYMAMDVDANGIELEFQSSFEELLFFITSDLANKGLGDYENEPVDILFNRDVQTSEGDTITNLRNSVGMISDETIVANHPYVKDKDQELKRIAAEKKEKMEMFSDDPFSSVGDDDGQEA